MTDPVSTRVLAGRPSIDDVDAAVDRLRSIGAEHGVAVGGVDARYVAGPDHLRHAARLSARARSNDDAIADTPAVELLLYAAGRRQIDRALDIGVSTDGPLAVVVSDHASDRGGSAPDDGIEAAATAVERQFDLDRATAPDARTILSTTPDHVTAFFDIDATEREATDAPLSALVRERVSLLAVTK
jgi:KEOPS complex subunit Cgi121